MKRAVAYHKSLTPEQQQAALDAETKTIPAKALEAGIGGPLAAVGSYAAGAMGIVGAGAVADALPSVIMHTIEGVKALNAWALKNPVGDTALSRRERTPSRCKEGNGIRKERAHAAIE